MERQQRDGENGDESVDAGALVGSENLPPPHTAVGEYHGDIQRHHGGHDGVEIMAGDHFFR